MALVSNFAQIVRFALPGLLYNFHTLSACLLFIIFVHTVRFASFDHFLYIVRFNCIILHTLTALLWSYCLLWPPLWIMFIILHMLPDCLWFLIQFPHIVRVACVYHFLRTVYFALIYPFTRCPLCLCDFAHLVRFALVTLLTLFALPWS